MVFRFKTSIVRCRENTFAMSTLRVAFRSQLLRRAWPDNTLMVLLIVFSNQTRLLKSLRARIEWALKGKPHRFHNRQRHYQKSPSRSGGGVEPSHALIKDQTISLRPLLLYSERARYRACYEQRPLPCLNRPGATPLRQPEPRPLRPDPQLPSLRPTRQR